MFTSILVITLAAAMFWAVKDCIEAKSLEPVKTHWLKYILCLAAGLIYGPLSRWKFFQYISVIGVVTLVAVSSATVIKALNWVLGRIGIKKTIS